MKRTLVGVAALAAMVAAGGAFAHDGPCSHEAPAHSKTRAIPECVGDWRELEPDPAPFLGMTLHPSLDADGRAILAACFDPAHPPSLERQQEVEWLSWGVDRYQAETGNRWSGSGLGTTGGPITLTWSLVPDGLSIPGGIGEPTAPSNLFATMDAKFGGNRALWISRIQESFDRWGELTGTHYVRVSAPGVDWDDNAFWGANSGAQRGHIRISMHNIDGVNGVLAYNSFPNNGDMVLDSSENWAKSSNSHRFLRNIVMHEHGHGLGFDHVCPINNTKLMEPFLSEFFDGPRVDDIRAAHRLYGDAMGANNSTVAATDLGTLAPGQALNPSSIPGAFVPSASLTSIDANGESDFFKITVTEPLPLNVTVTPTGGTYADYEQTQSCNTTSPNTNATTQADLFFDLQLGGTLQLSVNNTAAGSAESTTGFLLSPPGTYYVRVRNVTTTGLTQTQLYTLQLSTGLAPTVTASTGASNSQVSVSWTAIAAATGYRVYRATVDDRAQATLIGEPATNSFADTTALGGTTYFYFVEAFQYDVFKLIKTAGTPGFVSPPANDLCTSAQLLSGASVNVAADTRGAATDGSGSCAMFNDVWFRYIAPGTGTLSVAACGGDFDAVLQISDGVSCPVGAAAACNDQGACGPGGATITDFPVTLGGAYTIRLGGASAEAQGQTPLAVIFSLGLPVGSCCAPDGACSVIIEAECAGTWTSGGVCTPNDCPTPPPTGSCCLTDGSCTVTEESECTGTWTSGAGCEPNACPQPATGACCTGTVCAVLTQADCLTQSGVYLGDEMPCIGDESNPVTCCPANFDGVGGVNATDIFVFLDDWFAQNGQSGPGFTADFDKNQSVEASDIFVYLDAWFSGC